MEKWSWSLPSWITHFRPDGTITSGGENRISERILSEPSIIGDPVKVVCRSSAPILSSTLSKRGRVETRTTRRVVKIASYVAGLVGRTHRPIAIAMIRGGPAIAKRWLIPVVLVFRMDDQAGGLGLGLWLVARMGCHDNDRRQRRNPHSRVDIAWIGCQRLTAKVSSSLVS